ncbi:SDR family NAD(P)-dependent oxidoreductase [Peribacillus butanolivorans]|uniref:SDR family NAD(P)-dependent oxidoreductase n=1 Tax=Peribacillus butanolivorans TaxID=421767 RepID=UPI0036676F1B
MEPEGFSYSPPHYPSNKLAGKTIVVTGAGSGVGTETVKILHAEGAHVIINGRNKDKLADLASELGERVTVSIGDVTDIEYLEQLAEEAETISGGHVYGLVNNAGLTIRAFLKDTTPENFIGTIDNNLNSAVQLTRLLADSMCKGKSGSIVNVSSITSLRGHPGLVAYSASKAGMNGVTKALAMELAPYNVRVNAICPGAIDTPMTYKNADVQPNPDQYYESLKARHPMNRVASARDCALAILYLVSEDSSFVTGAAIPVDGGRAVQDTV